MSPKTYLPKHSTPTTQPRLKYDENLWPIFQNNLHLYTNSHIQNITITANNYESIAITLTETIKKILIYTFEEIPITRSYTNYSQTIQQNQHPYFKWWNKKMQHIKKQMKINH